MDNPEKLATHGTQYGEKHNTTRAGHHCTQTNWNMRVTIWRKKPDFQNFYYGAISFFF